MLFAALATAQPARPSAEALAAETQLQQVYAARAFLADGDRIERVALPLLFAAAVYCPAQPHRALGAAPRSAAQLPPGLRDAAAALGLDDTLQFTLVVPGTPAARAGVLPGDRLRSVAGQPVPAGAEPAWFQQQVNRSAAAGIALGLQRDAAAVEVTVTPQPVCSIRLRYAITDAVNAAAGVGQLMVTSGLLRFVADDAELALVLGHELAHVLLHAQAVRPAAKPRVGPAAQQHEREADRLGLYLAAAAGHDITRAADLWRRMAVRAPGTIQDSFSASHPSAPERFLLMQAVVAEIAARQRRSETLLPPLAELGLQPERADAATDALSPLPLPTLAQLPFLNDDGRAAFAAFSASAERPRALALSLRGHVSMRSGDNAASDALASCNVLARGACRLVALDDAWLGAGFLPLPLPLPAAAAQ